MSVIIARTPEKTNKFQFCSTNLKPVGKNFLSDYSKSDSKWDEHRSYATTVESIYNTEGSPQFQRLSARIRFCSLFLGYNTGHDEDTCELKLKLKTAQFCRVRTCPVCQWRRSLLWRSRFFNRIQPMLKQPNFEKYRFVFLTLTVKNCSIEDLRPTIQSMNKAWSRLIQLKALRHVHGWIRTTEVTRGEDGSAHPHFHCLLLVPSTYFGGQAYVTQEKWTDYWMQSMRIDYTPIVHIQTVKAKKSTDGQKISLNERMIAAACETLKYSVKEADLVKDPAWLVEYTKQAYKLRFIATGGILKDILGNEDQQTDQELIHVDDNADPMASPDADLYFLWSKQASRYVKV